MAEDHECIGRIRVLPVAVLSDSAFEQLTEALGELCGVPGSSEAPAALLDSVRSELVRHRGIGEESCYVTKDAVFGLCDLLDRASAQLALAGRHAGALATGAIRDRLIEALTEVQPRAPA